MASVHVHEKALGLCVDGDLLFVNDFMRRNPRNDSTILAPHATRFIHSPVEDLTSWHGHFFVGNSRQLDLAFLCVGSELQEEILNTIIYLSEG